MPTIKVFISYSWKNLIARKYLAIELRKANYEPMWDENNIHLGEHIGEGIINMLEQSDVVVILLTADSIESKFVVEELSRAHHQHSIIYPIVHESIVSKLPWFVDTNSNLRYTKDEELSNCIDKLIKVLEEEKEYIVYRKTIHREIRQQYYHVNTLLKRRKFESPEGKYLHQLAWVTLQNINDELSSMVKENYGSKVSKGSNFLMRAKPVFENASQIYAVSLDVVSSFWVSDHISNQKLARDYLTTQPDNTIRLFVFSNSDNAHNYVTVLNTHARKYGEKGRVFICSFDAYETIVNEFAKSEPSKHSMWLETDFAILEYTDSNGGNTSAYKATLDRHFFNVVKRPEGEPLPIDTNDIKRVFAELSTLPPGEIDPDYQVMRWDIDLQKRKPQWADKLSEIFKDREGDVIHLVFFTQHAFEDLATKERLRGKIRDVKSILDELREDKDRQIQCKDVWFGASHITSVNDARTNGLIYNSESQQFPYLLMMRFANKTSLASWYRFDKHSDLRRRLFESFNSQIADLFAQIDEIARSNPHDVKISNIYSDIEQQAAKYIGRRDYTEDETIIDIVDRTPFRPKIKWS
jgi:TIR domain